MNWSLLPSKHLPLAALIVLAFVCLFALTGAPLGREAETVRAYQLATGWTSLALMFVVMGYVLRKYAHRGGYSPEFRIRAEYANLERADGRIRSLRQQINLGSFASAKGIQDEATRILKEEGVHRVNRALVTPGAPGGDPWIVRVVPTEPLGRMARWMHVHAAYGTAFGFLLLMHSGTTPQSTFGQVLAGLGALVFVTGLVGIVLWALGPRWLTARESDLSIEEASAFQASLVRKRERAIGELDAHAAGRVRGLMRKTHPSPEAVRRVLQESAGTPDERAALQDLTALVAQECTVSKELRALRRVRASFMAWKLVHIPAAIVLTGLVAIHVVSIWKY